MKSSVLWALVGLNAVLLFLFIGHFNRPSSADAQNRRPSDYLLIPGAVNGGTSPELVYVIDITTGKLGGLAYDDSSHTISAMASINLNTIFSSVAPGTGAPVRPNN
jgi:hypothetical protein